MLRRKIALVVIIATLLPYLLNLIIPLPPLILLLISLVSTATCITLLLWFLKPLTILYKGANKFFDGNFNARIDLRTGDEFETLGNSFNQIADKISATIHQLENDRQIAVSEKNRFDEILSSVVDGIIALDFNKNVIFLNKASEELTAYTKTEMVGKRIDELIHLYADKDEILPKTYCQENFSQPAQLIGKMGKQTKVNIMTTPAEGTVQTNLSCILVLHDLSREEELEQMKLDFVSMASHELKTPLTSIIGYLSVFLDESKDKLPKESLMLLNKAFVSAQQLQALIANLLNVNKIEREQLSVLPEPLDYLAILFKATEDLRSQANQKDILLTINPTQNLPKVLADPIRLNEVITNLLSNAINYTNPGGKVTVTTIIYPGEVKTSISDTGVGIPKEAIPHLFNKFFRVSNMEQKASKGTGLGLYIAKSIIEKLHGKIWVESEVGKGSIFSFTLPTATPAVGILNRDKFVSEAIQSGTLNY